jgi:hypothetical protein
MKKRIFGYSLVGTFVRGIRGSHPIEDCWFLPGAGGKTDRTINQRRQRRCRERPSACVAPSVSPSLPSRCWSTCATVKTASFGQARHGAAPRTFPRKPSAWMVPTRYIPGRVTLALVSITISARPVGQLFVGPERPAPRDLASRSGHLTIRHSPLHRYRFGKSDDTRGRRMWKTWLTGTRNRLLVETRLREDLLQPLPP